MSLAELQAAMPNAGLRAAKFAEPLYAAMDEFDIDTPLRKAAFFGQVAHESGSLRYTREIADGVAYEGRMDLGNIHPGDGARYKGRGLLQITGRNNYSLCGAALGLDLINQPELLEAPVGACRSAGWFWKSHNLNLYANSNAFGSLTKAINGGYNHIDERIVAWLTARKALGL